MSDTRPPISTDPTPDPTPGSTLGSAGAQSPVASHASSTPTRDVAADEAQTVKEDAKASAQQVATVAKDEAAGTVQEAKYQVREVLSQARSELSGHASTQQERAASGLAAMADELRSMAQNGQDGPMSGLAQQAADRAQQLVSRLEGGQPEDLLDDLRAFARRKPGAFLAGAAVVGFLGGRLTRGLTADATDASSAHPRMPSPQPAAAPRPTTSGAQATGAARTAYGVDPIQGEGPAS